MTYVCKNIVCKKGELHCVLWQFWQSSTAEGSRTISGKQYNRVQYNRAPYQRYNCRTIADCFVYSFCDWLISKLRIDIAPFKSVLVRTCRWCLRWLARVLAVSYFPARFGWWRLRAQSDGLWNVLYSSQCKFNKQVLLWQRENCYSRKIVRTLRYWAVLKMRNFMFSRREE